MRNAVTAVIGGPAFQCLQERLDGVDGGVLAAGEQAPGLSFLRSCAETTGRI